MTDAPNGDGGMPGWVKVLLIVVVVLVATAVILNVTGFGGSHGPGRHMSPAGIPGR